VEIEAAKKTLQACLAETMQRTTTAFYQQLRVQQQFQLVLANAQPMEHAKLL